jgi:hypothetical protein
MITAKTTTPDFPFGDASNPDHRSAMEQWAKELQQDLAEGGYTSKRLEAIDRSQLKKIEKWLKLSPA